MGLAYRCTYSARRNGQRTNKIEWGRMVQMPHTTQHRHANCARHTEPFPWLAVRVHCCMLLSVLGTYAAACSPLTRVLYLAGSRMSSAAASPFKGSVGLGYSSSWGRNTSNTLIRSAAQHTAHTDQHPHQSCGRAAEAPQQQQLPACCWSCCRLQVGVTASVQAVGCWCE